MRQLSYSLAAAALLFLECRPAASSRPVSADTVPVENAAPEAKAQAVDPEHSSLSWDTLRAGAPIALRLSERHPERMAIIDPAGRYFYIQDPGTSKLMEATAFAKAREIRIDAALSGMYFVDGKARTGGVFTKSGVYTIYLADNLETEEENTDGLRLNFWFATKK
jgi:hypothetical protein